MKDTVYYELFIEPFSDGLVGSLIGILLWLVAIFVLGLFLSGSFLLIDYVGLNEKQSKGIVIEKRFEPAYSYSTIVLVGKVSVPQVHHVPNKWKVKIKINDLSDNFSLNKADWDKLKVNQQVNCTYTSGRLSNSIYIKSISW